MIQRPTRAQRWLFRLMATGRATPAPARRPCARGPASSTIPGISAGVPRRGRSMAAPWTRGGPVMASVRYIVDDIDEAVSFYRDRLGFSVEKHNPGKFAALKREDLELFINAPGAGSAGKAGGDPQPGGWSRFMIVTKD